jgi:hypothetical protein
MVLVIGVGFLGIFSRGGGCVASSSEELLDDELELVLELELVSDEVLDVVLDVEVVEVEVDVVEVVEVDVDAFF